MYVLHLEQVERFVLAERQVAAVLLAAGAKGVEMPTLTAARADFDTALAAEPTGGKTLSTRELDLRSALGLDRG